MVRTECASCDFWNSIDGKMGTCHRYPPTVQAQMIQKVNRIATAGQRPAPMQVMPIIVWTQTKADDFCGEHQNEV